MKALDGNKISPTIRRSYGNFSRHSRTKTAVSTTDAVRDQIWLNFELLIDVMVVLVTCINEEYQI